MIEKYGLFDSLEGDEREYAEVDFARLGRVLGLDGVRGGENALMVSAAPAGLSVTVTPGLALIQGRYYELLDDGSGEFTLNLSEAGSSPRIDRIVLALDYAARTVKLSVLKGAEATSPAPPALTRSAALYMLSLAQVYVAVGAGALDGGDVTDERRDEAVCGMLIASADAALREAKAAQKTADGKAPTSHASSATTYGAGNGSSYGHVKLSDATNSTSGAGAGVAATPAAVKSAYDLAAGKASRAFYTGTLTASGWSSSAPYTQTVSISGILAADTPVIDLNMSSATASNAADLQAAWACVGRIVTAANTITAYCYEEKPTMNLPLNILVVR